MTPAEPHPDERAELLAACDDALAAGVDAADLPPALADDLAVLRMLDHLRPPRPVPVPDPPDPATRYVLRALHGAGGVGQVWLAYDTELDREVALKLLRPERAADPALAERFLTEARVTSRLQHPGVVPVYDLAPAGDDGQPAFYTMRLVPGRTLSEAVADYHKRRAAGAAGPVELAGLLTAFVSVCQTVAYAHSRGVVHRDLKPSNVALGEFGEVVVLDWGFARVLDDPRAPEAGPGPAPPAARVSPVLSVAGQILGTPAYMAPEQADGLPALINERTDVYGLGAILYEILTGRPPFDGGDTTELIRRARTDVPPRPAAVAPGAPPALEAVCRRAMARDPARRYGSAAEVAREVQHWLADEPVAAHPEPPTARLGRWGRRHRPLVAGLATLAVTAAVAAGLGREAVRYEQGRAAEARTAAAQRLAEEQSKAARSAERQLYFHRVALAERTLSVHNPSRAMQLLDECPGPMRGWEWFCLNRLCRADPLELRGHAGTVLAAAFRPGSDALATGGFDGTARVWDAATGKPLLTLTGHHATVYDLAYGPGGRTLATAGWDQTARVWDADTGRELAVLRGHTRHVIRVAFSPDGHTLATLGEDDTFRMWETATGRELWSHRSGGHFTWHMTTLVYDPLGRFLALAGLDHGIHLLSTADGRELGQLQGHTQVIRTLAFSPDGKWLASGDGEMGRMDAGHVRVWEVGSGRVVWALRGHTDPVHRVAFSPDGRRLASAGQDHTVKLWDLETGQEALTLHAHNDVVRAVAFSPDGRKLASAGADRVVRVWDAGPADEAPTRERQTLAGHTDRVFSVAWLPGGRRLLSVGGDRTVRLWEPPAGAAVNVFVEPQGDGDFFAGAASPDGRWLASASSDGLVKLIDPTARYVYWMMDGHLGGPIKGLAFSPDGKRLASASWDRTVRLWRVPAGPAPADWAEKLYGVPKGPAAEMVLRGHTEPVLAVAWSPDGAALATASNDATVRVWDAATGAERARMRGHFSGVSGVAFSPDGKRVVSAGNDRTVRVWDAATGEPVRSLWGHNSAVRCAAYSPDGGLIASAGDDWSVRLWRADTFARVATLRGHTDRVHGLAFHPGGAVLATAGFDHVIRLWDVTGLPEAP